MTAWENAWRAAHEFSSALKNRPAYQASNLRWTSITDQPTMALFEGQPGAAISWNRNDEQLFQQPARYCKLFRKGGNSKNIAWYR